MSSDHFLEFYLNTIPSKSVYFSTKATTLVTSYKMVLPTIRMIRYSSPGKSKTSWSSLFKKEDNIRLTATACSRVYTASRADEQELRSTLLHNNCEPKGNRQSSHCVLSTFYVLHFVIHGIFCPFCTPLPFLPRPVASSLSE